VNPEHPWRPPRNGKRKRAPIHPFIGGEPAVNRGVRRHECKDVHWARKAERRADGRRWAWIRCICGWRAESSRRDVLLCNETLEARWNAHVGRKD
jgi:hypothetical protein